MTKSLSNVRVLIAEDDKDICELYSIAFKRSGFIVYTSPDGRSAIEKIKNKSPDIILLDIMMPNVDGYQVLKEVRKDPNKYTPVIMLTNLDSSHFEMNANFDDVDEYLIKSHYSPSDIVKKAIDVLRLNKIIDSEIE